MRPILHIQLPPQISKHLHLRSHLGSADLPERIKYLSQALRAEPANVQGIADPGTAGTERRFASVVFILDAAQRDRLGGSLADPVHAQVPIMSVVLHDLTDYLSFASLPGRDCVKAVTQRSGPDGCSRSSSSNTCPGLRSGCASGAAS